MQGEDGIGRNSEPERSFPEAGTPEPGPELGLNRRLTINSIANLARYGSSLLLTFFLTPFVVRTLGDSVYGFWVVLLSFVGYAGILEIGMQPTVVKVVGQHGEYADRRKLEELLGAASVFFAGVGILTAIVFAFVLPPLASILVRDAPTILGSRLLYTILAVDVLMMFLNLFLTGVLYGRQLYPIKSALDIVTSIINAVLLLLFLKRGGLLLLASAKLVTDFCSVAVTALIVRRSLPDFRISPRKASRRALRELLHFGGRLFVSATATRVATNAHPMVISSRMSAAATTFFAIPVRLVEYARDISYSLTSGFMPAFSQLDARGADSVIRSVYTRYSRYLVAAVLPIYVLILVYGSKFVGLWIGPEYGERARIPLALVGTMALLESFQPLYWRMSIGVGHINIPTAISAVSALASIAIGFLLVPSLGIAGPALAILATGLIAQVLYTIDAARYLRLPVWRLVIAIGGRPLLAGLPLYGIALLLDHTIGTRQLLHIGAGAFVTLAAYVPLALGIVLDAGERQTLLRMLDRVFRSLRSRPPRTGREVKIG